MIKRQDSEELPMLQLDNDYTLEQIQEFQKAFILFDKDKDGLVSRHELKKILATLGSPTTDDQLIKLLCIVSNPPPEDLDFDQFMTLFARRDTYHPVEKNLLFFEILDLHDKGFVTIEMAKHVLMNMGDKMTEDQVEEWMKEADHDGDGVVNREDFLRAMQSF